MNSNRLNYIDGLRGIMIFLVVCTHFPAMCTSLSSDNIIHQFISYFQPVRMPLFFLITGFFAYGKYDITLFKKRFINRLFKQLWPTILLFTLYTVYANFAFIDAFFDDVKLGYWFTYTLVQVWFCYACLALIVNVFHISRKNEMILYLLLVFISFAIEVFVTKTFPELINNDIAKLLSFKKSLSLIAYFYIGVILSANYQRIDNFLSISKNRWNIIIIIFGIFLYSSLVYAINHGMAGIYKVAQLLGVILALFIFHYYKEWWNGLNRFVVSVRYIGRHTLPIYLFHYFILHFVANNNLLVPLDFIMNYQFMAIPIMVVCSIMIIQICLWIEDIIKYSPLVHKCVLGA